jgi:cytochrome bd ubiquinol oxidase subunit II
VSVGFVIAMLWVYLYSYLILASIDFGAGVYSFYGLMTNDDQTIKVLRRYLSPFWDAIHIILLAFIGFITSFLPKVMEDFGYPLKGPAIAVFVILIVRTVAFTMKRQSLFNKRILTFLYGFSGVLVVVMLSSVLSLSEGGFLQILFRKVTLNIGSLFSSFYFWTVIILAIISILYISAMYFTFYSYKLQNTDALEKFRLHALSWCVPTLLASALVFVALQRHNPDHFSRILDISWMFLLSLVSYLIAVSLVFMKRHYALAFFFVLCQFFFAFYGYGWSHLPYILYPYIEIHPFISLGMGTVVFILTYILSIGIPSLLLRLRMVTVSAENAK